MTTRRFGEYSSQEKSVFNRFLDYYEKQPNWKGVRKSQ